MTPAPANGEYLKPGEVAEILHVSPKTVNRWANEGRIACIVTLGGHRRFRRADVESAVEQMEGGFISPPADEESSQAVPESTSDDKGRSRTGNRSPGSTRRKGI